VGQSPELALARPACNELQRAHSRQPPARAKSDESAGVALAAHKLERLQGYQSTLGKEPRIDTIEREMKLMDRVQLMIVGVLAALSLISPAVRIVRRRNVVLNLASDYLALGFVGGILLVLLEVLEAII
jgi:hypothetical protein